MSVRRNVLIQVRFKIKIVKHHDKAANFTDTVDIRQRKQGRRFDPGSVQEVHGTAKIRGKQTEGQR